MLLSGLFFGYMRRTAAMIEAGENRLRHLALHDPLCGLPNRNFFSETLEVVMAEIRGGGCSSSGLLHRPRSFQGRQRHAWPSHRRRSDPQRDIAPRRHAARRGSGRPARWRRVRRHHQDRHRQVDAEIHRRPDHHGALRALCHQRPQHRHWCEHRHRHHRSRHARRRRRHHALCRHGALPRQERRPQPRLHLRRRDGRRSVQPQVSRGRFADAHSKTAACASSTSRSSMPAARKCSASKHCCAGVIPSAASSSPRNSFRSPSIAD